MLTKKSLDEFKAIYKNQFGEDISDQEALNQATKLLNLMKVIYKPLPKKDFPEGIDKNTV